MRLLLGDIVLAWPEHHRHESIHARSGHIEALTRACKLVVHYLNLPY